MHDWQLKPGTPEQVEEQIRRAYQKGIDSGPSIPWDVEAFKKEARRRFELEKAKKSQANGKN